MLDASEPQEQQNYSSFSDIPHRSTLYIGLTVPVTLIICCCALFSNLAVIFTLKRDSGLREDKSNKFIINLAISDITAAIGVMLPSLISIIMDRWPFGYVLCLIHCSINYICIIVTMMTLAFISIDRYQAILHPLTYESIMISPIIYTMIGWTWLQGIIFSLPPVLRRWIEYDYWEGVCAIDWFKGDSGIVFYVIFANIFCFIAPGCIMSFSYVGIMREIKVFQVSQICSCCKERTVVGDVAGENQRSNASKHQDAVAASNNRIIKSLLVVLAFFFITLTPFCITKLGKSIIGRLDTIAAHASYFSSILQFCSSASNPFIYGIFRHDIRDAFKRQFRRLFGQEKLLSQGTSRGTNDRY